MKLSEKDSAFGRHETFRLRFSWLPKGYQEFHKDRGVFERDESTVKLGVGKNMVSSIRHWMRATQVLNEQNELSELAHYIFDEDKGADPYLEDEATIWLLHWLLCTNPNQATTWFWFFNKYVASEFDTNSMLTSLEAFVVEELNSKPSSVTLKNDCALLTRMYASSDDDSKAQLDEVLDSPMSLLGLINRIDAKRFSAELNVRKDLSLGVFGFAVAETINFHISMGARGTVQTKNLMYSNNNVAAVAAVFRLTESDFMNKLERLQQSYSDLFEIRDTAGISQIYLCQGVECLDPMSFLDAHYRGELKA